MLHTICNSFFIFLYTLFYIFIFSFFSLIKQFHFYFISYIFIFSFIFLSSLIFHIFLFYLPNTLKHTLKKLEAELSIRSAYAGKSYCSCLIRDKKYVLEMSLAPNSTMKRLLAKMKFVVSSPTWPCNFPMYSLNKSSWPDKDIAD